MTDNPSGIIQFIGRLHPLLVHLPIGFILLLAALEALALLPKFKHAATASRMILLLSVPVVICTAACGWLLSWSGGYNEHVLVWHKWLGTALVPAILVLAVLHWRGWLRAYRAWLFATVILLTVTGHFGGSLTHGSDFLFPSKKIADAEDSNSIHRGIGELGTTDHAATNNSAATPVFAAMVEPVLKKYCVGCHGPEKSKAKLRLDTAKNIFKGGKSGPVIQPGSPAQSLMIKRLLLPEDSDDHMPPSGKRQPGAEEIALLKWWINVGAPVSKSVEELKMPEAK